MCIRDRSQEQQLSAKERSEALGAASKGREREKLLEFKVNSMQQQVRTVNEMVQKLKEAMPSDELVRLVEAMQEFTKQKFDLQLLFSEKENELLENENQLRLIAKNDVGLSQKVINLRKQITEGREHLKDL